MPKSSRNEKVSSIERQQSPKGFSNSYWQSPKGFTLIELMIVVFIISVLAMLTFVAFSQVQKNARDTQRKGDLQTVAGVLQRFYSDYAKYPPASSGRISYRSGTDQCGNEATDTNVAWGTGSLVCSVTKPTGVVNVNYSKALPSDPLNTPQYCYVRATQQTYELYAKLEGQGNISATNCTVNGVTKSYNYRVTPND